MLVARTGILKRTASKLQAHLLSLLPNTSLQQQSDSKQTSSIFNALNRGQADSSNHILPCQVFGQHSMQKNIVNQQIGALFEGHVLCARAVG